LVSLKADTQFIPPLKDAGFLAQFLSKKFKGSLGNILVCEKLHERPYANGKTLSSFKTSLA
jgi:hypothetical protein